ncbi:MAG: hypothetical protein A3F84_27165 [Candidatus Handelsmanbacteria bacterium RIFCSPLOWO2_12_FULL_64_10]|uniref:GWxTD domain-containing protein n=1 Tax=Handelsmanbacteria sp. (strain RIFCSPLOWO2_12_FULL_64_10) TaxID=1817868 RepID=A0A1F6CBG8_HANXR|nr:MAG: hypothetical protein A3F84_27165 [Candidatus Handelsmanbacteria bacterium RIFCSPLOWO2_12_FULL_64_10]
MRLCAAALCIGLSFSAPAGAFADMAGVGLPSVSLDDKPSLSEGEVEFYVDMAGFRGAQGKTTQDVYLLIRCNQITFLPWGEASASGEGKQDKYVGKLAIRARVLDGAGQAVEKGEWIKQVPVQDLESAQDPNARVNDVISLSLAPGTYDLEVVVEDLLGEKQGICRRKMEVRNFEVASTEVTISDIAFGAEIERSEDRQDRFMHNGYRLIPNLTRSYGVGRSLKCYFEVYGFAVDPAVDDDSFYLSYSVVDTSGMVVKSYDVKRIRKPGESCVKVDSLALGDLPGGGYGLLVQVRDRLTRQTARALRRFQVLSADQAAQELTEEEKELWRYYSDIRYVATEKEQKLFKSLDQRGKERFLRQFWKDRDPTPETPLNEGLMEHIRRMKYSENQFAAQVNKRGSETDKGRVYIKYGAPDDIQYNTLATGEKSYEIWVYEKQGRYEFVFRDRHGNGIYELVHSTMPGERYNPNWREEL